MKNLIKNRHEIALKYPVFSTREMLNPACKKIVHLGKLQISSLFTIDCIEGDPKWHVSAASLPLAPLGSTVVAPKEVIEKMMTHAAGLLAKIGDGNMYTYPPTNFVHVFRPLSKSELEKISKFIKRGH